MGKKRQNNKSGGGKNTTTTTTTTTTTKNKTDGFPESLLPYKKKKPTFQVTSLVPSAVFVARNFMDENECKAWIKFAEESIGFEELNSPQTREFAHRQCGRISKTDWDMAERIYKRMEPIVKEVAKQVVITNFDNTYGPLTCNGNLRLYRYGKNMSFGRHFDGSERISSSSNNNNNAKLFKGTCNTEITVLVYLSSCSGGATRFYLPGSSKNKTSKKSKTHDSQGIAFVPEAGAVLMHIHGDRCLEHEADPVLDGIKYVLRTDIVYGPTQT